MHRIFTVYLSAEFITEIDIIYNTRNYWICEGHQSYKKVNSLKT